MIVPYADTLTPEALTRALNDYPGVGLRMSNPLVKRLIAATFPEYRGRKVRLMLWTRPRQLMNYWSGGSRSDWRLIDPARGFAAPSADMYNPFTKAAHEAFDLPAGVIAIEHDIFCGKDMGLYVYVRPEDFALVIAGATTHGLLTAGL